MKDKLKTLLDLIVKQTHGVLKFEESPGLVAISTRTGRKKPFRARPANKGYYKGHVGDTLERCKEEISSCLWLFYTNKLYSLVQGKDIADLPLQMPYLNDPNADSNNRYRVNFPAKLCTPSIPFNGGGFMEDPPLGTALLKEIDG